MLRQQQQQTTQHCSSKQQGSQHSTRTTTTSSDESLLESGKSWHSLYNGQNIHMLASIGFRLNKISTRKEHSPRINFRSDKSQIAINAKVVISDENTRSSTPPTIYHLPHLWIGSPEQTFAKSILTRSAHHHHSPPVFFKTNLKYIEIYKLSEWRRQ